MLIHTHSSHLGVRRGSVDSGGHCFLSYLLPETVCSCTTAGVGMSESSIPGCSTTTTCMLLTLGHLYPSYLLLFQVVAALSISRMWLHVYFSLLKGKSSHKVSGSGTNPVLRIYYIPAVLSTACIGNELFLVSLYMLYFTTGTHSELRGYTWGEKVESEWIAHVYTHFEDLKTL